MKSANSCPFSLYTPNKLFVRLVDCLINLICYTDIQAIITPPHLANVRLKGLAGINWQFAGYYHAHALLLRNQFVPCCTTKYIFWLRKNKFD